jgi:hypothetical protein
MAAKLLGISQPGAYFVFSSDSQLIVAAVDLSRAMHAPKSSRQRVLLNNLQGSPINFSRSL